MPLNSNPWNRIRYSIYAPFYDLVAGHFEKQRRRSIEGLRIKDGDRVLIVGAGTGLDLEHIPRGAAVTATDLTPAMVERLRTRAKALGMTVDACVMDGQSLEFPDDSFDVVILHLILAVIPDPQKCIAEVERVLKTDGRASVFDKFLRDSQRPSLIRRALNIFSNALFSDINRRLSGILAGSSLRVVSDEPAALGGMFRIIGLKKIDMVKEAHHEQA